MGVSRSKRRGKRKRAKVRRSHRQEEQQKPNEDHDDPGNHEDPGNYEDCGNYEDHDDCNEHNDDDQNSNMNSITEKTCSTLGIASDELCTQFMKEDVSFSYFSNTLPYTTATLSRPQQFTDFCIWKSPIFFKSYY